MKYRVVRALNTDCWIWTISRFLSRDVHGLLRPGQSSNRNYFQFRRHRFFLKYPSFRMNKPDRSLMTLPMTPPRINGKRELQNPGECFKFRLCLSAALTESPGVAITHRALPWQSWWEGRAPRGLRLLTSCWRAAWEQGLALQRSRQCFCTLHWKMKEY